MSEYTQAYSLIRFLKLTRNGNIMAKKRDEFELFHQK